MRRTGDAYAFGRLKSGLKPLFFDAYYRQLRDYENPVNEKRPFKRSCIFVYHKQGELFCRELDSQLSLLVVSGVSMEHALCDSLINCADSVDIRRVDSLCIA